MRTFLRPRQSRAPCCAPSKILRRDLALELRQEGSAGSRSAPRGKKGKAQAKGRERAQHAAWREAVRFVAVSQDGAGAFLNAIPMRDDMRMETWAMRLSVQRRLGLPLDVACQAAAAGKKTRNGKTHDELGDAAVNVPQHGHNTRHKYTLRRLILALRAAWGTAVRMEPKAHLGQSYNKQPDVDACNIGCFLSFFDIVCHSQVRHKNFTRYNKTPREQEISRKLVLS